MGIYDKIIGLFTRKPQSLGEGLARVKNMFNACGDDLAKIPGERLYKTPGGNLVAIHNPCGNTLGVQKYIMPHEKINYSDYVGKPAYLNRNYSNTVIGDTRVRLDRCTNRATFAEMPESKIASFFRRNFTNKNREFKESLYPDSVQKLNPDLEKINKCAADVKTVSDKSRIIPYTKAVSMGLKI